MNEGIHLDLDTWIVPGQIRKANLCRGLGNRYTPAGTEVLISAVAHNTPPPFQAAQNATTVNTRSSVAPCTAQRHTPASPECHPGVKRIGTSHRDFVLKGPVLAKGQCSHRWGQQTQATTPCKALPTGRLQDTLKQARKTGALNWGTREAAKAHQQRPGFTAMPNLNRGKEPPSRCPSTETYYST